jgi:hypothetical protein
MTRRLIVWIVDGHVGQFDRRVVVRRGDPDRRRLLVRPEDSGPWTPLDTCFGNPALAGLRVITPVAGLNLVITFHS